VAKAPEDPCNLHFEPATFKGRRLAEFFSLQYRLPRTYFTVQTQRQKKWAERLSAHLFRASCPSVRPPATLPGCDSESAYPVLQRSSYYSPQELYPQDWGATIAIL